MESVCRYVFRERVWNQENITAQHGMNAWPQAVGLSDTRNLSQKPADHQGQIPTLLGRGGGWQGMEGVIWTWGSRTHPLPALCQFSAASGLSWRAEHRDWRKGPTRRRCSSSFRRFSFSPLISCCFFIFCSCSNLLLRSLGGLMAYFLGGTFSSSWTTCHPREEGSAALHRPALRPGGHGCSRTPSPQAFWS